MISKHGSKCPRCLSTFGKWTNDAPPHACHGAVWFGQYDPEHSEHNAPFYLRGLRPDEQDLPNGALIYPTRQIAAAHAALTDPDVTVAIEAAPIVVRHHWLLATRRTGLTPPPALSVFVRPLPWNPDRTPRALAKLRHAINTEIRNLNNGTTQLDDAGERIEF